MKVDLVIARYMESLEWVNGVVNSLTSEGYTVRVFIYNKGTPIQESKPFECLAALQDLPNVGRESHTYLHHIITMHTEYKSNDQRYVVFLQAGFMNEVHKFYPGYPSHISLIRAFVQDAQKKGGASLSWATKHEYVGGNTAHWDFRIEMHNGRKLHPRADKQFGEWFTENVHSNFQKHEMLDWWVAALFCVTSSLLASQSLEYYQRLAAQLHYLDPEVGHYFERAWVYITGAHNLIAKAKLAYPTSKKKSSIL